MTISASADAPASGAVVHLLGDLVTFLLRAEDTGGGFTVVECRTAPGAGAPPHVQTRDDEAFLVLEGCYRFTIGGAEIERGPGALVRVPKGAPHASANAGDAPARMLILNWPGDWHERFFAAVGDPVRAGEGFPEAGLPDLPRLAAAAEASGIRLLAPAA